LKRSREITLILIASASLVACGPSTQDTRREIYGTRDKCAEDWGSGDDCEQQAGSGYYHGPHYFYRGGVPYIFRRGADQAQPVNPAAGFSRFPPGTASPNSAGSFRTSHISRGGFGTIGSFFRGGS
jgi:uncharacterized protein YgiB involved in biofilm formation